MDISSKLNQLAEKLRDKQGYLSEDSLLCQQAAMRGWGGVASDRLLEDIPAQSTGEDS